MTIIFSLKGISFFSISSSCKKSFILCLYTVSVRVFDCKNSLILFILIGLFNLKSRMSTIVPLFSAVSTFSFNHRAFTTFSDILASQSDLLISNSVNLLSLTVLTLKVFPIPRAATFPVPYSPLPKSPLALS